MLARLAVVGTVPQGDFPLKAGPARLAGPGLEVDGHEVPINRGTAALLAAALRSGQAADGQEVFAFLVGDIGLGDGSRRLYEHLATHLGEHQFSAIAFHYLQPDVDWQIRVLMAAEDMEPRPLLIADAGFMYAAKMSGMAASYDLFTPDVGELAFLADELAPHPFYTRGFILHEHNKVPELIAAAYQHQNAARHLLVKGSQDYLASGPERIISLEGPSSPAMEAIGGTGDTLTGVAAALAARGMGIPHAARVAALANRLAGARARPTPATQIAEILTHLPSALDEALAQVDEEEP